jgi:hypothetical protein
VSPSRTKASSRSSSGRWVSLPDALSVNTPSQLRLAMAAGFWSATWQELGCDRP